MTMKIHRSFCKLFLAALLACTGASLHAQAPQSTYQPTPVIISKMVDSVQGKAYRVHTVKKGHTLYSICRAYQTTEDSLLKDSPKGIVQADEFVYVPLRLLPDEKPKRFKPFDGKRPRIVDSLSLIAPDTATVVIDTVISLHPQIKADKDSLRVSLLLPLYSSTPQDKKAYIYLPYFEGASVAWQEFLDPDFFAIPVADTTPINDSIVTPEAVQTHKTPVFTSSDTPEDDTLAKPKPFVQFKVYDITQKPNSLEKAINSKYFQRSDAVVTLAFIYQFPLLDSLTKAWQMPWIHPISERDSIGVGNPYFIQLSASYGTQVNHIADFVKKHHAHSKILIISDSTENEVHKAKHLKSLLPAGEHLYFNKATTTRLEKLCDQKQKTVIVPFYAKEITAVKTILPLRQTKGNVSIIAPNVWLDYPTIEFDYYIQNNLVVYHTFCNAVQNSDFKEFSKKYYFLYRGLPSVLAYQGYKASLWLFDMLSTHNADFVRHLVESEEPDNILDPNTGSYRFIEREMGGFENTEVHFVRVTEKGLVHY